MNRFVLDTSVIVKWFSASGETDTTNALWVRQALWENKCQVSIPDLVLYELGNALRFNPAYTAEDVNAAMYSLVDMNLTIMAASPEILAEAITMAYTRNITVYDAYFLALAVRSGFMLVTADYKFYQKIAESESVIRLDKLLALSTS